jgi:outer membrane immunogenic protein
MRRVGRGLVVVLALAAAGVYAPARAADIAAPGPSYYPAAAAPMPPARYDWTGFYAGGQVGMDFLQDSETETAATTGSALEPAGANLNVSPYGVIGGGQIGANYEFAPWVVGVEGSWSWTYLTGSIIGPSGESAVGPAPGAPATERFTSSPQWIATATGRLGYAANDLLFYAKGGGAWMHVDYTQDILVGGAVSSTSMVSPTRSGFVAGAGVEYGLTEQLSARIEYDFYDFGKVNSTFNVVDPASMTGATVNIPVSIQSYVQAVTVGLNYRFNGTGGGFTLPTY